MLNLGRGTGASIDEQPAAAVLAGNADRIGNNVSSGMVAECDHAAHDLCREGRVAFVITTQQKSVVASVKTVITQGAVRREALL